MSKISFKKRYLSEAETAQTITNEINKTSGASEFASQNNKKETVSIPGPGVTQNAAATITSPQQSLVKANEAMGDMGVRATPNDATKVDSVLKNEAHRSARESSQTPFNAPIAEATQFAKTLLEANVIDNIDIDARIPGPFDNKLTKKLKEVGVNIGVSKINVSVSSDAAKSGQKNITQGTKASFTLGRHDASRQAKDGLKSPKKDDITKATMITAGVFLKVGNLVEEYTNADVEKSGNIPGNRDQSQKFQGVQPGYHQGDSARQTANMNEITDDKMAKAAGNRSMTAPENEEETKMGLHIERSNIVHQSDAENAQIRTQKEQRLSSGKEN